MTTKEILSMNLKFYRKKYNLSQEKFAERIGSTLDYINQIEMCRRNPSLEMLDKIVSGINNNIDKRLNLTVSDLVKYDKSHKTNFSRIDEKKK